MLQVKEEHAATLQRYSSLLKISRRKRLHFHQTVIDCSSGTSLLKGMLFPSLWCLSSFKGSIWKGTSATDGLIRLAKKLIVIDSCDRSLPQSALDLNAINTVVEYFKDICQSYVSEQIFDQGLVDFVEQTIRSQSDCSLWKELHNGCLTSSVYGEICNRRDGTSPIAICKRLMGYTKMVAYPPQIKWGKENEARAREACLAKMRSLGHRGIECQPSGLILMPVHFYLGASGDGIIKNHCYHGESPGALEIKCPFSLDRIQVRRFQVELSSRFRQRRCVDGNDVERVWAGVQRFDHRSNRKVSG